jgi:hypothetical protein
VKKKNIYGIVIMFFTEKTGMIIIIALQARMIFSMKAIDLKKVILLENYNFMFMLLID